MRSSALVALCAGCNLYFGSSPHDDAGTCVGNGGGTSGPDLRDPSTGACTQFSGCDSCGVCHGVDLPAWPPCNGPCDGLDEPACLANVQCHATYGARSGAFTACWNMIATHPDPNASCSTLDADACAEQHGCGSLMDDSTFIRCIALAGIDQGICYGSVTCTDAPPDCPPGTVAGIANSCWTGYCIPTTKCPD
jgi:hypothetical protein